MGRLNYTLVFVLTLVIYTAAQTITTTSYCTSRWSDISESGDDATAEAVCEPGEAMTGCGSFQPHGAPGSRDGEYIKENVDGVAICVAQNGANGLGVRAIARCCKWQDMECYYREGEMSSCKNHAPSRVECELEINGRTPYPTDCMAFTPVSHMDGALPDAPDQVPTLQDFNSRTCIAKNGFGGDGVRSYAACCSATNLECKSKWSGPSSWVHFDTADVQCDDGWQMTGCMGFTFWKMIDGAYIDEYTHEDWRVEATCKAYQGGNKYSVWAVAICCRINNVK